MGIMDENTQYLVHAYYFSLSFQMLLGYIVGLTITKKLSQDQQHTSDESKHSDKVFIV